MLTPTNKGNRQGDALSCTWWMAKLTKICRYNRISDIEQSKNEKLKIILKKIKIVPKTQEK